MRNTSHDEEKSCGVHLVNVIFYFIFNELQRLLNNFFVIVGKKVKNKSTEENEGEMEREKKNN